MLRQIIFASLLTIGSTLALVNSVKSQTSSSEVNSALNETNRIIKKANDYNDNVAVPEGQRYQRYLNELYQSCLSGDSTACTQYQSKMRSQQRWQIHLDQQYKIWAENRRF